MTIRGFLLRLLGLEDVEGRLEGLERKFAGSEVPFEDDGPMTECIACGYEYPHREMVQCHHCWNWACNFCHTTIEDLRGRLYDVCESCVIKFLERSE